MPYVDPDKHRESVRNSHARNPEIKRRWNARNGVKKNAVSALNRAVRRGDIAPEPCLFCDLRPAEAHHHDYTKPLDVTWLCDRHHKLVHRANWHKVRAATKASKPAEARACPECGETFVVPHDSRKRYCTSNCARRASYYRLGRDGINAKRRARLEEMRNTVIKQDTTIIPKGTIVYSTAPRWPSGGRPVGQAINLARLTTVQRSSDQIAWAGGGGYRRWVKVDGIPSDLEPVPEPVAGGEGEGDDLPFS